MQAHSGTGTYLIIVPVGKLLVEFIIWFGNKLDLYLLSFFLSI
jgi:hypothetical protein